MQQSQRAIEQIHQVRASRSRRAFVGTFFEIQPRLDQFQIPIAKLAPEEIIDSIRRLVEAIRTERIIDIHYSAIEPRKNPPIFKSQPLKPCNTDLGAAWAGPDCLGLDCVGPGL